MFCPNCGSPLFPGALFCGECGVKIENVPGKKDDRLEKIKEARESFISELRNSRISYPELFQLKFYDETESITSASDLVEKIRQNASHRYSLPSVPTTEVFIDVIKTGQNEEESLNYVITPKYLRVANTVFNYDYANKLVAIKEIETLLFNLFLMIPCGRLRLHIVDLSISLTLESFLSQLPESFYGGESIKEISQLDKLLDSILKKIEVTEKKYKDFVAYCNETKTIRQPYEVLVLLDGTSKYKEHYSKIRQILDKGQKSGIYVFLMNPSNQKLDIFNDCTIVNIEGQKSLTGLVSPSLIIENNSARTACFEYFQKEASLVEEDQIAKFDVKTLSQSDYASIDEGINVLVGEDKYFCMNTVNHVHTFIVGQSGSGKSVFLHNIISSCILQYAPEDLQLYLLDFKLGGVEFNRYKGVRHIKAMLVDNSDQQVTLEILRELRNSMAERGRMLRDSGVSNIREYNQEHPSERMPHVLLLADECHEMFRADDSIPRVVSNEISDIITKIAKEGRSQGVHLILATQTLSGAEISNEILNNVSDHYLLKCAASDSERLVSGSSDITAMQATGQIYYHHVDEQQQFQAFYTNKEEAAKIVTSSIQKAESHKSNGEFYFSGAQIFDLDASVMKENRKIKKMPVVYLGKSIDLKQKDINIPLKEDYSENVLLFGLNNGEQVTRVALNMLLSSVMASKIGEFDLPIKVINCLGNDESIYEDLIDDIEDAELCQMIRRRDRGEFLQKMAESIKDGSAEPALIFILGQDKFRELKMDLEFDGQNTAPADDFASMLGSFSSSSGDNFRTYRQALEFILDRGPEVGVHTIVQLEKPTNLLFEDLMAKEIFKKFKHLIMLRSDEMTASRLNLRDDIRLQNLSSEPERLRAYYYAEESDSYTLFTPYNQSGKSTILKQIEKL